MCIRDRYATEKLYDALRAGCIPIYKGAPDVRSIWHYANESIIFIDDYPSPSTSCCFEHHFRLAPTVSHSLTRLQVYEDPGFRNVLFEITALDPVGCLFEVMKAPS